ncbi:MAG: hypothetical protein RIR05_82 [Bacteroidota bacterium]
MAHYHETYAQSINHPESFWHTIAQCFTWKTPYSKLLNWNFTEPHVHWFQDGTLNITENCLDRHLSTHANRIALIFEPNDPASPRHSYTYKALLQAVENMAQVFSNAGIKKGDRVCIYMGMVPELAIAVLACARMGAIHSVIFGGFSAQAVADRINDAAATFVVTQDLAYRGAKHIPLKAIVDEALVHCSSVKHVLVYQHAHSAYPFSEPRDINLNKALESIQDTTFTAVEMQAEDPLFILYTSGSTGKPKGVVHTTAGYMIWAQYTFEQVFQYREGEVHFCTADLGWITGHTYLLYGPLLAGATTVMFEGIPTHPHAGRFWEIIDTYGVNIFYTAPTAIRSLMALGTEPLQPFNLNSLRVLGTVGEPINEEAWNWYKKQVGKNKCPVVDTWWQTETGGILISNLAGIGPERASWATYPLPGVQPVLVNEHGHVLNSANETVQGNLCLQFPWPGILRTTFGNHQRCRENYFSMYANLYFTGDGAYRDTNGMYRITGRVDDVLNVSGHRLGTAELENALNHHPLVVESAVVGIPHDIKGTAIIAFVICAANNYNTTMLLTEINATLQHHIGAIAKADKIIIVPGLPKTRSGKIMRRILRKIATGDFENLGDTSTLVDSAVISQLVDAAKIFN